jgi:predicted GIY-YIG superfamily endonuclease
MPTKIYQTSKAEKHDHIIYSRQLEGARPELICSYDKNHTHQVEIDEQGFPYIMESEELDHSHDVYPYETREPKKEKVSDQEKVSEGYDLYKRARQLTNGCRELGERGWDYYQSEQWNEADKANRNSLGIPSLTVNETSSIIDLAVGHFLKNEKMPHFKPIEGSDSRVADIYNVVVRNIFTQSNAKFEDKETFKELSITGIGNREVTLDTSRRIDGDARFKHLPTDYVFFGPHKRVDQSDLEYLVKKEHRSKQDLIAQYPEKKKELEQVYSTIGMDDYGEERVYDSTREYRYDRSKGESNSYDLFEVDKYEKTIAVFELWKKEFKSVSYLVDTDIGENSDLTGVSSKDIKRLEQIEGIRIVQKKRHDMIIRQFAGSVLLDEKDDGLPEGINDFNVFASYFRMHNGKYNGLMKDLMDLQDQINYTHSSAVEALKFASGRAEVYDSESFANVQQKNAYKQGRNRHGSLLEVADINKRPVPKENPGFPSDLIGMENTNSEKLHRVANIPPEMAGNSIDRTSGKAMLISRSQAMVGMADVFENWSESTKRLTLYIVGMLKEYYSPERIARIVLSEPMEGDGELKQSLRELDVQAITRLWKDSDLMDYDLEVSEAQYTDTYREMAFLLLSEMAQQGVQIPADEIIKASPLPNKESIVAKMQQQQQAAMQAGEQPNAR